MDGYIVDADTGNGVPNAVIIILFPGIEMDWWLENGTDADVYTFANADSSGYFQLPLPLFRDIEYAGIAGLEGYEPSKGFLSFDNTDPDLVTLTIEITK
ncbi:MAG: hypothetical protein HC806_04615 [Anaerolineae bacterium]|nr:hypothetical protein [Anaerolineae bacterium]